MTLTVTIPSELELVGDALRRMQSLDDGDDWPASGEDKEQARRLIDEGWESAKAGRVLGPAQLEADMAAFKLKWKQERGLA